MEEDYFKKNVCCSDYDGDSWFWYYALIILLGCSFITLIIVGIFKTIEQDKIVSTMNEEQKCLYQYTDRRINEMPAKCIKYFK